MSWPAPPPQAAAVFGEVLDRAATYAELLGTEGVRRGLIGPREVPRLWDRHLLNCAVVAELLDGPASVVDVGSGAGLPGVVLALLRPDCDVMLVESMARRVAFLHECQDVLNLANVSVLHGRAEAPETVRQAAGRDVVVSRAVAPLDRLAAWCLPLLRPAGRMLALKGESAGDEARQHGNVVRRRGGGRPTLVRCGEGVLAEPTTVLVVVRK